MLVERATSALVAVSTAVAVATLRLAEFAPRPPAVHHEAAPQVPGFQFVPSDQPKLGRADVDPRDRPGTMATPSCTLECDERQDTNARND